MADDDIGLRYGATANLRIDLPPTLEAPAPLRTLPVRAISPIGNVVSSPFSVGGDTGCANAALRVTGGIHATTVLGIGICPPNTTSGNAWINNQLVVGTDPGGAGRIRMQAGTTTADAFSFGGDTLLSRHTGGGLTLTPDFVIGTDPGGSEILRVGGGTRWKVGGIGPGAIALIASAASGADQPALILHRWTGAGSNYFHTSVEQRDVGEGLYFRTAPSSILGSEVWVTRAQLTGVDFSPASAAGLTLGTSALPWGVISASNVASGIASTTGVLMLRTDETKDHFTIESTVVGHDTWSFGIGSGSGSNTLGFYNRGQASTRFRLNGGSSGAVEVVNGGLQVTAGNVGVARAPSTAVGLFVNPLTGLTGVNQYGLAVEMAGASDATGSIQAIEIQAGTAAAAFTCATLYGIQLLDANKGAGSTITTQYGLFVNAQTKGTTNYSIFTNSGTVNFGDVVQMPNNLALKFSDSGGTFRRTAMITSSNSIRYGDIDNVGYDMLLHGSTVGVNTGASTRWQFDASGNLVADATNGGYAKAKNGVICNQAALATNATSGFFYLSTSAGTPTGVPGAQTGTVAVEYDTTNNKLMVYNGAWKTLPTSVSQVIGALTTKSTTSTTEVSLGTITLPGGSLTGSGDNRVVRIHVTFRMSAASVNNLLKVTFAGNTIAQLDTQGTNTEFRIHIDLSADSTSSIRANAQEIGDTDLGGGAFQTRSTTTSSGSLASNHDFDFRAKANSGSTVTMDTAYVELLGA